MDELAEEVPVWASLAILGTVLSSWVFVGALAPRMPKDANGVPMFIAAATPFFFLTMLVECLGTLPLSAELQLCDRKPEHSSAHRSATTAPQAHALAGWQCFMACFWLQHAALRDPVRLRCACSGAV